MWPAAAWRAYSAGSTPGAYALAASVCRERPGSCSAGSGSTDLLMIMNSAAVGTAAAAGAPPAQAAAAAQAAHLGCRDRSRSGEERAQVGAAD